MSLRILTALALSLAAGVAVLPLPALAESLTPVVIEQHGDVLNVIRIDTDKSSYIVVNQQAGGEGTNIVESDQTSETSILDITQVGGSITADIDFDGGDTSISVKQIAGVDGDTSSKDGIKRGVVDGNYVTVYNNGGFGASEVQNTAPQVGVLGGH